MAKYILSILFVSLFIFGSPISAKAEAEMATMEAAVSEVSISVKGSTVRVVGANGCTLSVYNVAGIRIMTMKIDGSDKQYDLDLPKGCYILQVGKTVRKISIR